ncbi:MAG: KH domain-containing protein [Chloroflexota bacterium]|nr:KH domain-containing protein [Chloroflexota bacterium]
MRDRGSVEISATSVEDAIELALDQMGLTRDEVDVEVLREPGEPDEHGYASDEALVLVSTRASHSSPPPRRNDGERRSKHHLSPAERMRVAQIGQEALSDLLHHLGLVASCRVNPASLSTSETDAPVVLEVEGEDLGVLIGKRGDNLEALQYILNLMVQKWVETWPNITVDVAGYRKRREEVLEQLARRMARRVVETQQPFTFEPMPPRERRIVHMSIEEDSRVTTESLGEGMDRRVVIYPAR